MKKQLIRTILLIVLLLLAVVLGMIIGNLCEGVSSLSWLAASASFGLSPTTVDLAVINITLGFAVNINVAQAILLLAAIVAYCNIRIRN